MSESRALDAQTLEKFDRLLQPILRTRTPDETVDVLFSALRDLIPIRKLGLYFFKKGQTGLVPLGNASYEVLDIALTLKEEGVVDFVSDADRLVFAPIPPSFGIEPTNGDDEAMIVPLNVDGQKLGVLFIILETPSEGIQKELETLIQLMVRHTAYTFSKNFELEKTVRTREYLDGLLSTVNDVIYATDEAGLITFINNHVAIFGLEADEMIGHPIYELIPFEQEEGRTIEVLQKGRSFTFDVQLRVKGRRKRWFQVNQVPYRNDDGEVIGSLGTLRDISERIRLEDKLRESERMAALSRTAISLNHEINNPLSVIQGNLYLLELSLPLDQYPKAREQIEVLRNHSQRIARVVRKLDEFQNLQTIEYAGNIEMYDMREPRTRSRSADDENGEKKKQGGNEQE